MRSPGAEHRKIVAWAAVAAWTAVILVLSSDSFSSRETSRILGPLLDFFFPDLAEATREWVHAAVRKSAHVAEYAVLGALSRNALLAGRLRREQRAFAIGIVLVAGVATLDEVGQALRAARTGSAWDVALDVAGGAAGIGTARLAALHGQRKREGER